MASSSNFVGIPASLAEGYSITRPPLFNGTDYSFSKISANAKVLNILHYALDVIKYNRVSGCENIVEMSTRFIDLVNLLKALGKSFEEAELVKKFLRSLPKSWEANTTVIFDTKDFTRYTYDELIGSLITHKMIDGKKKSIALKIDTSESSSLSNDEEEMAMLARKFRRTFRKIGSKYKRFVKKYGSKNDSKKDPKEIICYECNKPDHIRLNCSKSKKKRKEDKGKKAMVTVWDATDESSSDDSNKKNEANLCCMALEEETAEPSKDEEMEVTESKPPNIEELELAFAKVYNEYKTYKRKCASLNLKIHPCDLKIFLLVWF
ncbi:hypothetical protein MANES_10G085602v8 [Manihot esculenta]|uniref:Uncharacterized protein n=1 Tax=Manihot esculenta TaxID=3983 RepID=A0ACC8D1L3_MANES|nr:hypothetical protein MANES_10G085602v8 [Manihot esculenta]